MLLFTKVDAVVGILGGPVFVVIGLNYLKKYKKYKALKETGWDKAIHEQYYLSWGLAAVFAGLMTFVTCILGALGVIYQ